MVVNQIKIVLFSQKMIEVDIEGEMLIVDEIILNVSFPRCNEKDDFLLSFSFSQCDELIGDSRKGNYHYFGPCY